VNTTKHMTLKSVIGLLVALFVLMGRGSQGDDPQTTDDVFQKKIAPLLKSRCGSCHSGTESRSGLTVTSVADLLEGGATRGAAIVPGHPEQSVLVKLLRGQAKPRMPFQAEPLPNAEIALIEDWIRNLKAPDKTTTERENGWWAVRKLARGPLPDVRDAARVRNPIDRFVMSRLESEGIVPAPEAPPEVLLRRVFYDLVGMPPTLEEAREFLDDRSPDAYERLIDRLLGDSRYGERWGRHWLDVVRFADSGGSEYDREYSHMWRYRDYVIRAFNNDLPYDRFVIEQLAGDEIDAPTPASRIALGFLRMSPEHGSPNKDTNRQHLLNELTATVGSAFLGVTLSCAQCHEHKYDPITQRDYYRIQAFLVGVRMEETDVPFDPNEAPLMAAGRDAAEKEFARLQAETSRVEGALLAKLKDILIAEGVAPEEAVKKTTKEELDRRLADATAGAGATSFTVEEKQTLERLRIDVTESGADGVFEKGAARRRIDRYLPKAHTVTNVNNDYFARVPHLPVAFVRIRGEYDRFGEMVRPGFLSAVTGNHEPATPRTDKFGNLEKFRIGLGEWIASADNPLSPRVIANRLWQQHLGQGIVRTANNFGRNGTPPTHPELLDWLAVRLIDHRWSLKGLHRTIMGSATYRQSSNYTTAEGMRIDPQNRLLWRMNRRRLDGEVIRDGILSVSGRLNRAMGGPAVYPPLPEGMEDRIFYKRSRFWEPSEGPEGRRRSVYIFKRRQLDFPLLAALDAPVFNTPAEARAVSTTPLQALLLMNGRLVNEEAAHFARRLETECGDDPRRQVVAAYRLALCRDPSDEERQAALEFIAGDETGGGLHGFCRVLFNLNEFVYVD
jgi:Protein of unknown function (DUF1553)/Protein of unknown function (DUF1549)/Planctomycete cytochrome C